MKKYYRYFGGFIKNQEKWLNRMASKGYRLIKVEKLLFEFEKCNSNEYQYCVDFVGNKSKDNSEDYKKFLEEIGYIVFYKNINLNYSIGKIRYRPWANKGGRMVTNNNIYNKELMVVEKKNDGKPFELHTSYENKVEYYHSLVKMWGYLFVIFLVFCVSFHTIISGFFSLLCLVPTVLYGNEMRKCMKEGKVYEE